MRPGGEQSGLVRGPGRLRAAIATPFVRVLTMHGLPSPSSPHSEADPVSYSLKTTRPEAPLCLHGYIPSYQYQPPPVYPNTLPITALPAIWIGNTELLLCSRYLFHHHSPSSSCCLDHLSEMHKPDASPPNLMQPPWSWVLLSLSQLLLISLLSLGKTSC